MAPRGAPGRLLLASLAWARGRGPDLAPLAREVRAWPRLLDDAGRWGIAESLAFAVAASGPSDPEAVPEQARARLRAAHEAAAAANLALLSDAVRLQELLARAGIPSVAIKGTALVAAHYPLPGARHVGDLDLLVPRARLVDAAATLAPEAFGRRHQVDHDGGDVEFDAHLPAFDTPGGICCELHFGAPGDRRGALAGRVLARARKVKVAGGTLSVPAPDDAAAVACLHVLAGHPGNPVFLPRLVADLEALDATAGLDWRRIRSAAGIEGAPVVDRARALLEAARRGDVAAVFPGTAEAVARDLVLPFLRLAARDPRAGLRAFVPSRRFMAERYGVAEDSPRILLLYVLRPWLALRERLRR